MNKTIKILVTGGHGLVGSAIQRVVEEDETLSDMKFYFPTSSEFNLLNVEQMETVFAEIGPNVVIHLAARVGGLFHNQNNNLMYYNQNLDMSRNLLTLCELNNVKYTIGFLSTCIYPVSDTAKLITPPKYKESELHNGNPHPSNFGYAFGKRQHEILGRLYNTTHFENRHYCLVPPNIYGLNDNFNPSNSHVIPGIIEKMNRNSKQENFQDFSSPKQLVLPGSGQAKRQFVFSEDVARQTIQFLKLLLAKKTATEHQKIPTVINIGNDSSYTIAEVAEVIYKQFHDRHKLDVSYKFEKTVYHPSYDGVYEKQSDLTLWKSLFGEPKTIDLEEGMRKTVDWFLLHKK